MHNILEYKDGTIILGSSGGWEDKVEMGRGRAKGVEFFAQKTKGRTTGWMSYTLAWSDRWFPGGEINGGEMFPYKYDRRHSINIYVNHKLSRRIDLNASWMFASGGATTVPLRETAVIDEDGRILTADYVKSRNNYRLPPTHLLNIGAQFHFFHRKRPTEGILTLGVYNAYNSMNPNFVMTEMEYDEATGKEHLILKKITILPIIPSISYTLKF